MRLIYNEKYDTIEKNYVRLSDGGEEKEGLPQQYIHHKWNNS